MKTAAFALLALAAGASNSAPPTPPSADPAKALEHACGLPSGSVKVRGNEIDIAPTPSTPYKYIGCVIAETQKLGLTARVNLPPESLPSREQTIDAIVRCDVPRANIAIAYTDYLQSDEVKIADLGPVSDAKLRCLKAAVHPVYILTLQNAAQQAAFSEFSEREDRPKEKSEAREWLRSKGLLDRLPSFDPKETLETFATKLESACGLKRGGALTADGPSQLSVRPDFVLGKNFDVLGDSIFCLMQMFSASDAKENGVRLFFTGNDAYRPEDKAK